ncbi:hypothetical protein BH09VER1_BH09VER1_22210 [soil metagenome]
MTKKLSATRRLIRRLSCLILPPCLAILAVGILSTQFIEISSRTELLSLTSFVVLLSFSALAFNWSRVSPDMVPPETLKEVYEAAIDFFIASLLALVSTMFSWLQSSGIVPLSAKLLFAFHWIFLLASIALLLVAILALLRIVSKSST